VVATRVAHARSLQRERAGEAGPATNAEAEVGKLVLEPEARALAEQASERLGLSPRGFTRTLRVARSIADLATAPVIRRHDIAEALAFRHRGSGRQNSAAQFQAPRVRAVIPAN
jgi:magnesium chelatase family protein